MRRNIDSKERIPIGSPASRPLRDVIWNDVDWNLPDSAIAESLNLALKAVESGRRRMEASRSAIEPPSPARRDRQRKA